MLLNLIGRFFLFIQDRIPAIVIRVKMAVCVLLTLTICPSLVNVLSHAREIAVKIVTVSLFLAH